MNPSSPTVSDCAVFRGVWFSTAVAGLVPAVATAYDPVLQIADVDSNNTKHHHVFEPLFGHGQYTETTTLVDGLSWQASDDSWRYTMLVPCVGEAPAITVDVGAAFDELLSNMNPLGMEPEYDVGSYVLPALCQDMYVKPIRVEGGLYLTSAYNYVSVVDPSNGFIDGEVVARDRLDLKGLPAFSWMHTSEVEPISPATETRRDARWTILVQGDAPRIWKDEFPSSESADYHFNANSFPLVDVLAHEFTHIAGMNHISRFSVTNGFISSMTAPRADLSRGLGYDSAQYGNSTLGLLSVGRYTTPPAETAFVDHHYGSESPPDVALFPSRFQPGSPNDRVDAYLPGHTGSSPPYFTGCPGEALTIQGGTIADVEDWLPTIEAYDIASDDVLITFTFANDGATNAHGDGQTFYTIWGESDLTGEILLHQRAYITSPLGTTVDGTDDFWVLGINGVTPYDAAIGEPHFLYVKANPFPIVDDISNNEIRTELYWIPGECGS